MTTSPLDYATVAGWFGSLLGAVTDEQLSGPTPCPDWDVRALGAHVIDTHRRVLGLVDHDIPVTPLGDGDPREAWPDATSRVTAALTDPARADATVSARSGGQTFAELVGSLLSLDTLCHAWDLARATGQPESIDAASLSAATALLEAQGDSFRVPGGYGPAVAPAPGDGPQERFLKLAGRTP